MNILVILPSREKSAQFAKRLSSIPHAHHYFTLTCSAKKLGEIISSGKWNRNIDALAFDYVFALGYGCSGEAMNQEVNFLGMCAFGNVEIPIVCLREDKVLKEGQSEFIDFAVNTLEKSL